ncbi:MAG: aldose 1-epimerase family protein [bacterium]|nr:aldose 1-epimerase family protein [bacterium]
MIRLFNRDWTRADLLQHVGEMRQIAGVSAVEGADGPERGARCFDVYTDQLAFRVLADRALDLGACRFQGTPLAWQSPAGDAHPAHYEAGGAGWLRTFGGGLLTTCGLDQFGAPNTDGGESFGLHGRISTTPAREISARADWDANGGYTIEIGGEVRQARLFGEYLTLRRAITTRLGEAAIHITDDVTNHGYAPQPHMILYHFNLGWPLISPAAGLHLPVTETHPRDPAAVAGLESWSRFQPPAPGYAEQVFRHVLERGSAEVVNPESGLRLTLEYDHGALPHLFQWKMMGQGAYVCGLEPANSSAIQGRAHARAVGDLPHLQPGETRRYTLKVAVSRA